MKKQLKVLKEKISKAKTIVLFSHKNLDGDALCSVLALADLIELNFGKTPVCLYDGNIPAALDKVPMRKKITFYGHADTQESFDLAIVLDYGTAKNIGGPLTIMNQAKYIIEIDHHKNDNHVADLCFDDENASSVGEILYKIMIKEKWKYDLDIEILLAVSILTDTGFFRYSRSGEPLHIMAKLVDDGVDIAKITGDLNNKPRRTIQVEAAAAANAKFFYKNTLVIAVITNKDYKNLDGRGETVLNLLEQIKGVKYIALLKEQKKNQIGISLRSKAKPLNKIAESFGGGGHALAAGAVVKDSLENVYSKILEKFKGI